MSTTNTKTVEEGQIGAVIEYCADALQAKRVVSQYQEAARREEGAIQ
jgi:hypothetical protein